MTTHVLFAPSDLAELDRRLGPAHDITRWVPSALDELQNPLLNRYRQAAKRRHRDGDMEIDADSAVVSIGEDAGAYVLSWLWIDENELASGLDAEGGAQ